MNKNQSALKRFVEDCVKERFQNGKSMIQAKGTDLSFS